MLPIWLIFVFVYGILIETRVFGELIPLVVCATMLIVERMLIARIRIVNSVSFALEGKAVMIDIAA